MTRFRSVVAIGVLLLGGSTAAPVAATTGSAGGDHASLSSTDARDRVATQRGIVRDHMKVVGHTDLGGSVLNADVWAHHGYAYVGVWSGSCPATGVKVVDYSKARRPRLVSILPTDPGTSAEDIVVRSISSPTFTGDLAVTGIQRCDDPAQPGFRGLAFFDVTTPEVPRALGRWDAPAGSIGCHEIDLAQRPDGTVLAACANILAEQVNNTDEVVLVDATDPTAPATAGGWSLRADLGIDPADNPENVGCTPVSFAHSVRFVDDARSLYASYWDFGAVRLDVTNPAAPALLDRADVSPPDEDGDVHSVVRSDDDKTLIVNSEDFSPVEGCPPGVEGWGEVHLFDLAGSSPSLQSTFSTTNSRSERHDGFYSVHNTELASSSQAFSSWYSDGIVWWDFADPARPVQRGQFVPPTTADPTGSLPTAPIVWGVFVDRARDLILASDMNSGLWIVRPVGLPDL